MKLVVPEGEEAFTGVSGDRQAQGMGIAEQDVALITRELSEVGNLMDVGAVDC